MRVTFLFIFLVSGLLLFTANPPPLFAQSPEAAPAETFVAERVSPSPPALDEEERNEQVAELLIWSIVLFTLLIIFIFAWVYARKHLRGFE